MPGIFCTVCMKSRGFLSVVCFGHAGPPIGRMGMATRLRLLGTDGKAMLEQTHPLSARYPVNEWKAGELVRAPVEVFLPAHLPAGEYRWVMQIGRINVDVGSLHIDMPPRETQFPPHITRVEQVLDGFVALIGYQVEVRSEQAISVTLYWRAQAETTISYKVFVHLIDAQGHPLTQSDAIPARWTRPTTGWLPPEVIADVHTLVIPANLAAGEYRLVVGLYDPLSGRRAITAEGAEQITLGEQTVP